MRALPSTLDGCGVSEKPEESVSTSPKVCQCDGQLVERDQDGIWCVSCGKRKVAAK
jgi:ribosomal protein L37AE/L43A